MPLLLKIGYVLCAINCTNKSLNQSTWQDGGRLFVPRFVRFSWLKSPGVEVIQVHCCSDDTGLSLTLLFHDICPQTQTIVKVYDLVATFQIFTYLLHQFFLCLLQFSSWHLYSYLLSTIAVSHHHCSSPVSSIKYCRIYSTRLL